MRHRVIPVVASIVILAASATAGWAQEPSAAPAAPRGLPTDPAAQPGPARHVLVIAKIEESSYRRAIEEAFKQEFGRKGVEVLTGTGHLTDADFASEQALEAKARSLGVDAILGVTVADTQQDVKSSPSVGVSVGIPVQVGPFSIFAGTSVPLGGGARLQKKVSVRLRFYNRPGDPAWETVISQSVESADTSAIAGAANRVAQKAVKELAKKKLIAKT